MITLTWQPADADVDLVVVQPNGVTVDYTNKKPGGHNGQLDIDMRKDGGPENYSFTLRPGQSMPAGQYVAYLVYYSGRAESVDATVRVRWNEGTESERRLEPQTIRLRRGQQRQRIAVYEFTIPE